jgi:hypothetical protein
MLDQDTPPDWYLNERGETKWDADVTDQQSLTDKGIDGLYLGKSGTAINESDGSVISYNTDGSKTSGPITLPEVVVKPDYASMSFLDLNILVFNQNFNTLTRAANPLYLAFNAINSSFTGVDYMTGAPMNNADRGIAVLSVIPISKAATVVDMGVESVGKFVTRKMVLEAAEALNVTTSSKSLLAARTYTIYNAGGELVKFGVTDTWNIRMNVSRLMAGPGAKAVPSLSTFTKQEAHILEKYLRSLQYNSTQLYYLPSMKVPYPINFETGAKISPLKL